MSSADQPPTEHSSDSVEPGLSTSLAERYSNVMGRFVHGVELAAATVFAGLFAIGVVDLILQIFGAVQSGSITDPLVVIGFIDTGLLLLIIVEVYQTVLAYVEENDTRRIVQLVIYTGVIAMVRKVIIFRTSEYPTLEDAVFAAGSYAIIIFALVGLLFAERVYGNGSTLLSD
ncbi:phosphate-starvation-inducible PsiE family protein [Halorhabdus sp. CUG00001]|uniref:phosphate-starvation-inducible PsiE family protein n=1 Tax=Halorhabdus sp. CUG00001 TaxID=2600297 RepID=UPI00131BC0B7|nr:phosphate-starvation-inducible PsiE family protein [Halorhabdus sp. CUG00001]